MRDMQAYMNEKDMEWRKIAYQDEVEEKEFPDAITAGPPAR